MDDAAKAAKRAEIEAKVAAMKAEQKKQEVSAPTRFYVAKGRSTNEHRDPHTEPRSLPLPVMNHPGTKGCVLRRAPGYHLRRLRGGAHHRLQVQVQEVRQPRHLRGVPRALGQREGLHGERSRQADDLPRPQGPRLLRPQGARVQAAGQDRWAHEEEREEAQGTTRTIRFHHGILSCVTH